MKNITLTQRLVTTDYINLLRIIQSFNILDSIIKNIKSGNMDFEESVIKRICNKYIDVYTELNTEKINAMNKISRDNSTEVNIRNIRIDTYKGALSVHISYKNDDDIKPFLTNGWIIDNDLTTSYRCSQFRYDELVSKYMGLIGEKIDPSRSPYSDITFQVTNKCNLCCTYCYQNNKGQKRMSFETGKKAIDFLLSRTKDNCDYINPDDNPFISIEFVGGDGLLEIDLVDDLLNYFVEQCVKLDHPWLLSWKAHVSTNGVLYRNERVQEVINKWGYALDMVITVDGNKELHDMCRIFPDGSGSYDLAMDAVLEELNKGNGPGTKITLSPDNLHLLSDSIIDLINNGLLHIWFNGIYEHNWTVEEAKLYYNECKRITDWVFENNLYDKIDFITFNPMLLSKTYLDDDDNANYCGGDGHMLAISPDGEFYNCLRYMDSSLNGKQKPLRIGDIDNGIGVINSDIDNIRMMKEITRKSQSTDECLNCPLNAGCSWCSAYNYEVYGTPNKRSTNICNFHKAEILATFYYWVKMYMYNAVYPKDIQKLNLDKSIYHLVNGIISANEFDILIKNVERVNSSYGL